MIEVAVVLALVVILSAMGYPRLDQWRADQALKGAVRSLASAFSFARSEAIRSGNNHIVFFQADAQGNALFDPLGNPVPVQVIDDGAPGSPLQNCIIDPGEIALSLPAEPGVNWGVTNAAGGVPTDFGGGLFATGSTFTDPVGVAATWVLFRPEGTPLAFSAACATGPVGSGSGAAYLTNGRRDHGVVLTALGGSRVHTWNAMVGQWTN